MPSTMQRIRFSVLILILAALAGVGVGHLVHVQSLKPGLESASASKVDEVKGVDIGDVRYEIHISKPYVVFGSPKGHTRFYTSKRTVDGGYEYGTCSYTFVRQQDQWIAWDRSVEQGDESPDYARALFGHPAP